MDKEKRKILIIDDDPVQIDSLSMILEHIYDIASLNSGIGALEEIRKIQPDLIMLDINMEGIDGFEVCNNLKNDKELSEIPIIFCSARLKLEDKVKGFQAGGVDYITKPFEMEEVMARLETHLKLKEALQTINEYNQNLQERVEKQSRELIKAERHAAFSLMVKGIVHNLKNPLSVVFMNTDTIISKLQTFKGLLRNSDCNEETYEYIDEIIENMQLSALSCRNMNESLNMLMTKSYSEKKLKRKKINLNELISNEIKFLSSDLAFKKIRNKNLKLSDEDLLIKVVPSEISQILQNLIKNSIDALEAIESPEIIVSTGQDNDMVWFSVKDNGTGISEDKLLNIFDPFFSTKSEKEDNSSGLGLGLYFCNEIIKSYNGKIEVKSSQKNGTIFKVIIPSS